MIGRASPTAVEEVRKGLVRQLVAGAASRPRAAESQEAWELLIAGYLYLGGLGAGSFVVATLAAWFGRGLTPAYISPVAGWDWAWSAALVLWGPFVTAAGATLLVFHLGRNWKLAFTAARNPRTSWMARGFAILSAFILVGGVVALVSVFLPSGPDRAPLLWNALEAVGVVAALGTAAYTGILLQSMKFIPAWRSPFLPLLFLASALSTGAMGVAVGAVAYRLLAADPGSAHELVRRLDRAELFLLVAEAALLALYLRRLLRGRPEGRLSASLWLTGRWRLGFWGGIVTLALALPFVLALANLSLEDDAVAVVAALSVLTGGFVLRCGVLAIGVKQEPPLHGLARWRALNRAAASTGEGAG